MELPLGKMFTWNRWCQNRHGGGITAVAEISHLPVVFYLDLSRALCRLGHI
jgi:hypothetical protein